MPFFTCLFNIPKTNWEGCNCTSVTSKLPSSLPSTFTLNIISFSVLREKKKGKNDSPIILRHCCQLFGRHRMEQRGALSIINSPLVVLSTRPMHFLKKYPVNMLCIGLVKRLDKRNQHPRNWCELCLPASAHNCLPECSVAGGLTWPPHLNMQFKGFQETFFDIITCQRHLAGKHKQFFYRGIYSAVLSCCLFW